MQRNRLPDRYSKISEIDPVNSKDKSIRYIVENANVVLIAVALVLAFSQSVSAQDVVSSQNSSKLSSTDIVDRYPPGTIQSTSVADQALTDVQKKRDIVEAEFAEETRACYPKFFTTSCMDAAKDKRRSALAKIKRVEIEANAFKRRERVKERDKALAEKTPDPAPIIKQPAKELKTRDTAPGRGDTKNARSSDDSGKSKRTGQSPATSDRVAQHKAKLERLKAEEAAGAQKRAENVADFEKKARDAAERQREVAAKKAEKERERAGKTSQ